MTVLLIGDPGSAALLEPLLAKGVDAAVDERAPTADRGEIAALADELLRLESVLRERPPTAVLLLDAGDTALAAALVATKLLIPVAAVGLDETEGENARLLAQLTDRKLPADAGETRAWIESLPTLSEFR
jgi:hypothetical protein